MTSWHHFHSTVTQPSQKLNYYFWHFITVRCTYNMTADSIERCYNSLYVKYVCEEQLTVVYSFSKHDTIASFPLNSDPEFPIFDPTLLVLQCKGALIWLWTSLKGAQTIYLCQVWMWEAINSGLQPQPWHDGIISTRQWPIIAIIWPNFVGLTA